MLRGRSRLAAGGILVIVSALAGAILLAPGATGSEGARAAKSTKVTVGDNFYSPTAKTIKKGTRAKFNWTGANRHNVRLKKGPGKKFKSKTTRSTGVNFARKFKKRGTYRIFCSIHPDQMNLTLKVK